MGQQSAPQEYIENIRIANNNQTPLTLIFEPWFSTYEIPPGEHVIISSKGPVGDGVEITLESETCTVWGWPGSSTVVIHKGEIVIDWRELTLPSMSIPSLRALGESIWITGDEK